MKVGKLLFTAGAAGLLGAIVAASRRHPAAPGPPPATVAASSTGGVAWLALPAAVVLIITVAAAVLAYRRRYPKTRRPAPAARRVHGHWYVILNARPAVGGPWAVVRRGYREQVAASRAEVKADVEREAAAIHPHLRYSADVVEAQPAAVR